LHLVVVNGRLSSWTRSEALAGSTRVKNGRIVMKPLLVVKHIPIAENGGPDPTWPLLYEEMRARAFPTVDDPRAWVIQFHRHEPIREIRGGREVVTFLLEGRRALANALDAKKGEFVWPDSLVPRAVKTEGDVTQGELFQHRFVKTDLGWEKTSEE
jgi:hypothetical protein